MIYTVTFNPAIDYIMHTGIIKNGATNRSSSEEVYFGGKGVNVSFVLNELGLETKALGFVAGFTGIAIEQFLAGADIKTDFVHLESGFSRINVKIKGEEETEINGRGPDISPEKRQEFLLKLDDIRDVMHLGESYYAKKDFKRSLECFEAALKGSKDAMTSYNCMKYISFIHKKNKEYSKAVELWQKMERIMPSAVQVGSEMRSSV